MNRLLGPRWMFPVYWMAFLGVTALFHRGTRLDADAALVIIGFSAMFFLGAWIATFDPNKSQNVSLAQSRGMSERQLPQLDVTTLRWAIVFGSAANLGAAALAMRSSPVGLGDVLTLRTLAASTNALTVNRYEGATESAITFVFLGVGYVAALVAPFIRLTGVKRHVLWTALPAVSSVAYATVTSARLGFLISAGLTLGGVLACAVIRNGVAPRVKPKTVLAVVLLGIIVGGAFTAIGVLRTGRVDALMLESTVEKQVSYTVGTVGAFASWYNDYWQEASPGLGYGTATIAGMEYLTGQDREATRAYGDFAIIDDRGRTTNVYTAFRGLILDFGIPGTVALLGISGFIFGRLYLSARDGSLVAGCLLGFGYASLFFSGWMATTTFTNVLAVVVAAPAVLLIARRVESQSARTRVSTSAPSVPFRGPLGVRA